MQFNPSSVDWESLELLSIVTQPTFAFLGFASDTGVRRNHGRAGAVEAPNAIRSTLMHSKEFKTLHQIPWVDCGNVVLMNDNLEAAQLELAKAVTLLRKKGYFPLVLGGGHETAYGHYLGIIGDQKKDIQICNLDAHFDLRDLLDNNCGSSGTPFWQIAQYCHQNDLAFHYSCWGIQPASNSEHLFSRANDLKVNYLLAKECSQEKTALYYSKLMNTNQSIYLTVCLDVLAAANAPGVSAPQLDGVKPEQLIQLIKKLAESERITAFDIVELAPKLDVDNKTSQLAAKVLLTFMQTYMENHGD